MEFRRLQRSPFMATFYWKMKPHSLKVLGNHIESIPIPSVSLKEQREIVCLVEDILIEKCFLDAEEEINKRIYRLYRLNDENVETIKAS